MRLSEAKTGDRVVVVKVTGHGALRRRVIEMGFVRGREIKVLGDAPLKDPVKYGIMGYEVMLRASEARMIEVVEIETSDECRATSVERRVSSVQSAESSAECPVTRDQRREAHEAYTRRRHQITVALIGNPNCGKTSLFNMASGAREHTGNYSGVTVDAKSATMRRGDYTLHIVDLPGTYSLTAYSPEELYVRRYLREEAPDVIVNVVDASNLERNLYLTTELIDMDRSMVVALNMWDELRHSGTKLDYKMLGGMIGVPMVPIVSKTGEGVDKLLDTIIEVYNGQNTDVRHVHVKLGNDIEKGIRKLVDVLKQSDDTDRHFSPRYLAIKLLEGDEEAQNIVKEMAQGEDILEMSRTIREALAVDSEEDIAAQVAAEKYGFISGALTETMSGSAVSMHETTRLIDAVVTNRVLGFPIFLLVMFAIFWATFAIGQYPMDWIEEGVTWLSDAVGRIMPSGILKDMIADGIIGGVGGVIVFLPNIMILYFCISWMEDSGYMARAAFIMDKLMHRIGLHGKSFIPLIMGFGCNVPAIMASRTIESRTSRIITILINPFMSCSARLPIYVLLIGTFFPGHAAPVFMGIYLLGIVVAIITAKLLRRLRYKSDETPFVMELPPYRVPTVRASMRHTWEKGRQYLRKMGGIILVASIIIWALNYFPTSQDVQSPENNIHTTEAQAQPEAQVAESNTGGESYLQMAGKAINPLMEPLGFHWRATVAALAGIPAKEIVVSTLGVLYSGDEATDNARLGAKLRDARGADGKPDFTAAAALAFMVFILLYCPCIATVTAIVRETKSWKYGLFSVIYNTAVAWLAAFIIYNVATWFT